MDLVQQKTNYLGLRSYRTRNFSKDRSYRFFIPSKKSIANYSSFIELMQFGTSARGMLYIQLSNSPKHYLVIVITDDEFRYALISVNAQPNSTTGGLIMEDIAWLDLRRIHGGNYVGKVEPASGESLGKAKLESNQNKDTAEKDARLSKYVNSVTRLSSKILMKISNFNLDTQVLRELYAYCW
jgi:mediator of RNA polymerase II transcription subunit 14